MRTSILTPAVPSLVYTQNLRANSKTNDFSTRALERPSTDQKTFYKDNNGPKEKRQMRSHRSAPCRTYIQFYATDDTTHLTTKRYHGPDTISSPDHPIPHPANHLAVFCHLLTWTNHPNTSHRTEDKSLAFYILNDIQRIIKKKTL